MNLEELIKEAFHEDLPTGTDVTTDNLNLKNKSGLAHLRAKQDLVLSGREIFQDCFNFFSSNTQISWQFKDSDKILKNQIIASLRGPLDELLKSERVALNFLGHLSGIATLTHQFVEKVSHTKTQILDTRKTIPLFRSLEKKAVLHGGGTNHRMSLSDSIMIKDNHICAAGSIEKAVNDIREHTDQPIILEVKNLDEVQLGVELKVAHLLLDNMSTDDLRQAVQKIPESIKSEASGNMTLDRISEVAKCGVDFISVGALTHSAPQADFSLQFEW